MKSNVGKIDQIIRIVLGLAMIAAGVFFSSWWGAIGIIPLFTALVRWCPLYMPIGFSSDKE